MATELVVRIVGDASSLENALKKSSRATSRFGRDMDSVGRGSLAAAVSFRGLGRSVAFASASFLGGFGLATAVRGAFEEMSNVQKAAAQTQAVIKSTGGVAGVTAGHVDDLAVSLTDLSGVSSTNIKSAENLLLVFTNVRNVVGKGNDIFDRASKAALDLSVRFDRDLGASARLVGKALQDPVKGLSSLTRQGVAFTAQQKKQIKALVESGNVLGAQKIVLDAVTRASGGAAKAAGDTLGGKLGKLRENVLNMEVAIATLLLPAITKIVDRFVKWTQNTDNQKRVLNDAKQVIGAVTDAANVLKGAFEGLNTITGSTKRTVELLVGAFVTFKALKLANYIKTMAESMGLLAANSRKAAGALPGTSGGPAGPPAPGGEGTAAKFARNIGKAGAMIAVAFAGAKGLQKLIGQAPLLISPQSLRLGVRSPVVPDIFQPQRPGAVRPPAGVLGPAGAGPGARRPGVTPPPPPPVDPKFLRAANEALRAQRVEEAQFVVEKTALTKTIADDIAANEKLNALLLRRIKGDHDTLDIRRQQLQVQLTINALLAQQAEARKAAAEAAQKAARAARSAREFAILGLGPTGAPRTPTTAGLRRELAQVSGLPGLDKKARDMIARVRKLLRKGGEGLTNEVRDKVKEILDGFKDQLRQSSVDVTRFQKTARGQLTLAGAHPTGGVVITGPVHFHGVQNVKQMEEALAKRRRQRANARRSTR